MLSAERLARIRADVDNYHDSMSEKGAAVLAAHTPALLAEVERLRGAVEVRKGQPVGGCGCPACKEASDGN